MNVRNILGVIIGITLITAFSATTPIQQQHQQQQAEAYIDPNTFRSEKAPTVISGDNVYVVWFTDKGTPNSNGEVIFRVSTDGGATFGNKTNLSNTTDTDSVDAEIDSDADSVVVTWWERNQTANAPVMRVSTDNGATFGPTLVLATNGTLGEAAEEEPEGGE
jgi:hypothetical protein